MNKNTFFCVDYRNSPEYSGDSFKDALNIFISLLKKYAYSIEDSNLLLYYDECINHLSIGKLGYPLPRGASLKIYKMGRNFTDEQSITIRRAIYAIARDYELDIRNYSLEHVKDIHA